MKYFFNRFIALSSILLASTLSGFAQDPICPTAEETKLYDLINAYRAENGLPPIPISAKLTKTAQLHARDTHDYPPTGACNLHSWSSNPPAGIDWTDCCYVSGNGNSECMWKKPFEIAGYGTPNYDFGDKGYEISAISSGTITAEQALDLWKNSPPHNAAITNQDIWEDSNWKAIGIGIYQGVAHVWFGEVTDNSALCTDDTPPVITVSCPDPIKHTVGQPFTFPIYTATDPEDGDITANVSLTITDSQGGGGVGTIDNTTPVGTYILTYTVTDASGHAATPIVRTVNIVLPVDNAPPVITLSGTDPMEHVSGQPFTSPTYTATDNEGNDLTASVSITTTVGGGHGVAPIDDTTPVGTYTLTYTVSDGACNPNTTSVTRTAHVVPSCDLYLRNNYLSINEGGVNLMTGDLNMDFSLAGISGRSVSYNLGLFYNSRLADQPTESINTVGGQGWKLMDYPKILNKGGQYYLLDGQRSYPLKTDDQGYHTEAPYHLWKFSLDVGTWTIQTEGGTNYELGHVSGADCPIYHLSKIEDRIWGDRLDFTYNGHQLTSITNQLDEKLQCRYDGNDRLVKIESLFKGIIQDEVHFGYTDGRLSAVGGIARMSNDLFTEDVAALEFDYNPDGRLEKIISPSGAIRQYTYHSGAVHPELTGKVIGYNTDSGYPVVLADGASQEVVQSAIWYDTGNEKSAGIYQHFNNVRVYPGGTHSEADYDNFNAHDNPFGHESYYFFNGKGIDDLLDLPTGSDAITDRSSWGTAYRVEHYNSDVVNEAAEHLTVKSTAIYELKDSHHSSNDVRVPLLRESRSAVDGVDEHSTWYEYDNDYYLPTATIYSRQNPTPENPGKKEYVKAEVYYAYKDYPMAVNHLLTPISRQHRAVVAYSGNTSYSDNSLNWKVTEATLTRWREWGNGSGKWVPQFTYRLHDGEVGENNFPAADEQIDTDTWLATEELLEIDQDHGHILTSRDPGGQVSSFLYDDRYAVYPVATFYNADNSFESTNSATTDIFYGFESNEIRPNGWGWENAGYNTSNAQSGSRSLQLNNNNGKFHIKNKSIIDENKTYIFSAYIKNTDGENGTLGFWRGSYKRYTKPTPQTIPAEFVKERTISSNSNWQHYSIEIAGDVLRDEGSGTYKKPGAYPLIQCNNCLIDDVRFYQKSSPSGGGKLQAGYYGFEAYEEMPEKWEWAGAPVVNSDAHTGSKSLRLDGSNNEFHIDKEVVYDYNVNGKFLFGVYIKNRSDAGAKIGFWEDSEFTGEGGTYPEGFREENSISVSSDWIYYYVTVDVKFLRDRAPVSGDAAGAYPLIRCNDCLIDDIRIHPLDAAFEATVYRDNSISEEDHLTINSPGDYVANLTATVKAATAIGSGQRLTAEAGQQITVEQGFRVAISAGASMRLSMATGALPRKLLPIASLGQNGEVVRYLHDALDNTIATEALVSTASGGKERSPKALTLGYGSREGIAWYGATHAGDQYFDPDRPHATLQLTPRQLSAAETFRRPVGSQFNALSGMAIGGDLLRVTGSNASANFSKSVTAENYAIHAEVLPGSGFSGRLGMQVWNVSESSGTVWLGLEGSRLVLQQSGNDLEVIPLQKLPPFLSLTLVVMEGNHVFAYADGRFLFDHTFTGSILGPVTLTATNAKGSAFDNFLYLEDPIVSKETFDASGATKQTLVHYEPNKLMVTEELYGTPLDLPMATTRGTYLTTTGGLTYRPGFANLTYSGGTLTVSGEVQTAHGFDTPFASSATYESDPRVRVRRSGSGGLFTVGAGYGTRHRYENNDGDSEFGFANNQLHKKTEVDPKDKDQTNEDVTTQTYTDPATGVAFASTIEDHETGRVRKEQVAYDEQLRLKNHLQPNAFEKDDDRFQLSTEYDFLGNILYEQHPDAGSTQYVYNTSQQLRVMMDAAGCEAGTPYFHYWKYDRKGRLSEEGLYEAGSGSNVNFDEYYPNLYFDGGTKTVQVPGVIYIKEAGGTVVVNAGETGATCSKYCSNQGGSYCCEWSKYKPFKGLLHLKAGKRIRFEQNFKISVAYGQTMRAEIVPYGLLAEELAHEVDNADWPTSDDTNRKVKRTYHYDLDEQDPANPTAGKADRIVAYHVAGNESGDKATEQYIYDLDGRTTRVEQAVQDGEVETTDVFKYTYNQAGQITHIHHDISNSIHQVDYDVRYTYDRLGRIKTIGTASDPDAYASYAYDNDGFTETLGNGVSVRYGTNDEGQPYLIKAEKSDGTLLFEEELHYTERENGGNGYYNGLIAGVSHTSGPSQADYEYYYDGFGQLIRREEGTDQVVYTYDANGNLENKNGEAYTYPAGSNKVAEAQGSAYAYDALGRVKKVGSSIVFTYDQFTGLTKTITDNGTTYSYHYGIRDERVKKAVGGKTIKYFRGLNDYPLIEAVTEGGTTTYYTYVYGPTGLLMVDESSSAGGAALYTATMEAEYAAREEPVFAGIRDARSLHPEANRTEGGRYAAELNTFRPLGPALMLPVSAGDSVSLETWAYYQDNSQESTSPVVLSGMDAAAADGIGNHLIEGLPPAFRGVGDAVTALAAMHGKDRSAGPKAYLNYMLFDEHLNYVTGGYKAVSESAKDDPEQLSITDQPVPVTGYFYAYLSYEGQENRSVWFDELAVAHAAATGPKYVIKDHLGSTRVLADAAGNGVDRYNYDAFGEEVSNTAPSFDMRYLYTGQEYEKTLGLYNYRARLYNPELGRFYTPDPAEQQHSPYAYVGNNPISNIDPNGESFVRALIGVVIGAVSEIVMQAISGEEINWKDVGISAMLGAISGIIPSGGSAVGAMVSGAIDGAIGAAITGIANGDDISTIRQDMVIQASIGAVFGGTIDGSVARMGNQTKKQVRKKVGTTNTGCKCGCGCFTKDTPVKTAEGEKPIQTIQVGDQVWAFNEETGQQELRTVSNTFTLMREATYTLKIEDEWIETTSDHPFYIGDQWVEAASLSVGDSVLFLNNRKSAIEAIDFSAGYIQVYNFEVEGLHNYYVGEEGVLVHNTKSKSSEIDCGGVSVTAASRPKRKAVLQSEDKLRQISKDEAPRKEPRPSYKKGLVQEVWKRAIQADGNVYDPNIGIKLFWDTNTSRLKQWHMGHKPGKEYRNLKKRYDNREISHEDFINEYNNPDNYHPEDPKSNQSGRFEHR